MANLSPIKVRTSLKGFRGKSEELKASLLLHLQEAHRETMKASVNAVKESIRDSDAIASSNLLNSVSYSLVSNANRRFITSSVYFEGEASSYAGFAEYGRKAGNYPPPKAIERWMDAKGIDKGKNNSRVYWTVINIGKKGTKGHFFLRRARKKIRLLQKDIYERALNEFKG